MESNLLAEGHGHVYFCEKSHNASKMVYQNLTKTRFEKQATVIEKDYKDCLKKLKNENISFDIIYIDPPYKMDYAVDSVKRILQLNLLQENGTIIIETDEEAREIEELKQIGLEASDLRKYGRVSLIFLN